MRSALLNATVEAAPVVGSDELWRQRVHDELSSQADTVARVRDGPGLECIEGRGTTVAYLKRFTEQFDTKELRELATRESIAFLKKQIQAREQALKAGSSVQAGAETALLATHLRTLHAQGKLSDEQFTARLKEHATAAQRRSNRECIEAGLRLLQADLQKREAGAFTTSRDIHRHVVKAQCDELMCRWCELPAAGGVGNRAIKIGEAVDPVSGYPDFGPADYFLSYNWDTPWSELLDALEIHSAERKASGSSRGESPTSSSSTTISARPTYYWIDIFAVNQHEPWNCAYRLMEEGCSGCAAVAEDMHDWDTADPENPKGFERVIAFTQKTVMLMEPWYNPRPPTRVWCLFEGNTTLAKGGQLEVVLSRRQKREMQIAMADRFSALEQSLASIDVRRAEATMLADRDKIYQSIEELAAGFEGLNHCMKAAMSRWLADTAVELVERQRPGAQPLGADELQVEMQNHARDHSGNTASFWIGLANRAPRLASCTMLVQFLVFSIAIVLVSIGVLGGVPPWSVFGGAQGGPVALLGLVFPLACLIILCCQLPLLHVSMSLSQVQQEHQLRTPPLFEQGRKSRAVITVSSLALTVAGITFPFVGAAWGVGGVSILFAVTYGCFVSPRSSILTDRVAMLQRTELAVKAGWVELKLDRAEAARALFLAAHEELLASLGSDNLAAWNALPGLLAATKQVYLRNIQLDGGDGHGCAAELQNLRRMFEDVAAKHLEIQCTCTATCSNEAGAWRTHQATVLLASADEEEVIAEVLVMLTDAAEKYGATIEAFAQRHRRDEDDPAWEKFTGERRSNSNDVQFLFVRQRVVAA